MIFSCHFNMQGHLIHRCYCFQMHNTKRHVAHTACPHNCSTPFSVPSYRKILLHLQEYIPSGFLFKDFKIYSHKLIPFSPFFQSTQRAIMHSFSDILILLYIISINNIKHYQYWKLWRNHITIVQMS